MSRRYYSGFSLTELMLVVGLVGIVMLGMMSMTRDAFRTQKRVEAGQDTIMLTGQLDRILSDAPTCTELLKGTRSENGTSLILGRGLYAGARLGQAAITSLKLIEVTELTDDVFLGKVELQASNVGSEGSGVGFNRRLPLVYRVDNNNFIDECLGDNFGRKGNCTALGGKWDESLRECDFCPALGGQSNARGRCQLVGAGNAACPFQQAFGGNSKTGVCGESFDTDFIGESIRYLGQFGHVESQVLAWFRRDLEKHLSDPPKGELDKKTLGGRGAASWIMTTEPPNLELNKPCATNVFITVKCR